MLSRLLEGLEVQSYDVVLELEVVLLARVETSENVEFTVSVVATGAHPGSDGVGGVD